MARTTPEVMDLLLFIDNEAGSIAQALRMAADRNDGDAEALTDEYAGVRALLHESAASWRAKADRLEELVECLPEAVGY